MWDEGQRVPSKEEFVKGLNGEQVVKKLFNSHEIERFTYTKYNPESGYPMKADQPYWWKEWSGADMLGRLSKEIVDETTEFKTVFEGDDIIICNILGICSKVDLGHGVIMQAKMLDLNILPEEEPIFWLNEVGIDSGIILKTERSYHYYGFDLLSENDWQIWIKKLMDLPKSDWVFGEEYLSMCLERGYSALRIFGYEGTSKKETPVLVERF